MVKSFASTVQYLLFFVPALISPFFMVSLIYMIERYKICNEVISDFIDKIPKPFTIIIVVMSTLTISQKLKDLLVNNPIYELPLPIAMCCIYSFLGFGLLIGSWEYALLSTIPSPKAHLAERGILSKVDSL